MRGKPTRRHDEGQGRQGVGVELRGGEQLRMDWGPAEGRTPARWPERERSGECWGGTRPV